MMAAEQTQDHELAQTHVSTASGASTWAATVNRSTVLPLAEDSGALVVLGRTRFEPLEVLGQGGMGEVHLVRDHDMQRSIAMKRLSESSRPDLVRRFVAEIRTVAQLEHPNIVPVHDVGVDAEGNFFFIMKHVKGETLESLIARLRTGDRELHRRWTFNARARLLLGVLNAVAYAHERGVLHRDLKPANIMVGAFGEVTVMDWGIACTIAPVRYEPQGCSLPVTPSRPQSEEPAVNHGDLLPREVDTQLVGTPFYVSPEQARKENSRLDQRSDVYALGVVLHELLFLRHYLEGRSSLDQVLDGVLTQEPDVQRHETGPGQGVVPAELGWFIDRAMKKDPALRFQTVHEMRDELERVLAGRFRVQCQRTAFKRLLNETMALSDRYPKTVIFGGATLSSLVLMSAVQALLRLF